MLFSLPKEVEQSCPHCPVNETAQFVEHMYRAGNGTWEQLEDYCQRLKKFQHVTNDCTQWVKEPLAKLVGVPGHHVSHIKA
jgi:hypothetical protein